MYYCILFWMGFFMTQIRIAQNMSDNLSKTVQLKFLVFEKIKYTMFILDTTLFPFP